MRPTSTFRKSKAYLTNLFFVLYLKPVYCSSFSTFFKNMSKLLLFYDNILVFTGLCKNPRSPVSSDQCSFQYFNWESLGKACDGPKAELICGVCHRLFSSASSLTAHMRLHRGGRALSCQHCGKAFIHNKRLQSHEASCRHALTPAIPSNLPLLPIQPKEEPLEEGEVRLVGDEDHFVKVVDGHVIYFCSVCERSYMTLSSLKRHSNVHSWRRKYPCHFCDKVFALAEYRTKHEVWHTGERRYQCIFCWEAFATYYNLKTHQKAFHGISPGLISSEKTANGGYKQKVNALKFYRLLPMRSQKRPYKTYSDSLANGLQLPPSDPSSVPLPLDCSLPDSLDPGDLCSLISGSLPKELGLSSVITYGHPKPSVIVHGTAVSSVIVHSNQVTSGGGKSPLSSPSSESSNSQTLLPKSSAKPVKKHRESTESHRKRAKLVDSSDVTEESERRSETGRSHHKSSKSDGSSAKQSSEGKGAGPLCQITVRIGEEAMVKRTEGERGGDGESRKKSPIAPGKVREYYFRQEVRKQGESEDDEDNLWRPYYSYKPKRKAPHIHKAKNWQAKLHYKRSLRLMKRAEGIVEVSPMDTKRRPWSDGSASECDTCGRWFSSSRKRDKHELSHLLEFVPSRLSRRSLARHTCSQCHKVCKTSSALNRHVRRHDGHVPVVQSVPAISYSVPEPQHSSEGIEAQHPELNELATPVPDREPSPLIIQPPSEIPMADIPDSNRPTPSPSSCTSPLQGVLVMSSGAECLDYRTPRKRSLEGQSHRRTSPAPVTGPPTAFLNMHLTSQMRINHTAAPPSVAMTTGCGMGLFHHAGFKDSPVAQDVRVLPLSRSPSPNQAQDLTMSSILAREMERVQQTRGASHPPPEQLRDKEMILLVPKEEPISPAPSPIHTPIQTTINNRPLQRRPTVSPCLSPTAMDLLMQANRQVSQSMCGTRGPERLQLPTGSVGGIDRPSAHALLLPRVPPLSEAEPQGHSPAPSRDPHRGEVTARGYPMQDYPLPLIVQSGYCSSKKQEDNLLMSYPTGPLAFGPLGKMMPTGDLAKLPFYPDPYHLLYGPQLLAYPYNLASLPMALNMMSPGDDKVAPLPFLPALFNYAAAAGPYTGMLPHHLVANPSLYNSGGGSSRKQRDSSGGGKP
ncbi:unnamed protein product [Oncorhynchus mykiss]|uniref:C2H2-type domain-containing protein n=1 Tax=Oncorhynchus mykiss TaxID=8022 RepID=A0A060XNT8_ONCMY|nr:unnamed protein product [Oncorhynchus mykiss]